MWGDGGKVYWERRKVENGAVKGIVVIFGWVSVKESDLCKYADLYSSFGWNSLVCYPNFLNVFFPEKAATLAFLVLNELIRVLRVKPCPVVFFSFSGGAKACMYKVIQMIAGSFFAHCNQDDIYLMKNCLAGNIFDSGPIDCTSDLGASSTLHPVILRMFSSPKLVSWIAKGIASGLDAVFLTRLGSQNEEFWQTLYSSVDLGAPFLFLCSESDSVGPCSTICKFAQHLLDLGGDIELVKWSGSAHADHYENYPVEYSAAVLSLLEKAYAVYSRRIQDLESERALVEAEEISGLICSLRKAAVSSSQSFERFNLGTNDQFLTHRSPSDCSNTLGDRGTTKDDGRDMITTAAETPSISAHSILGQVLFDACVPKNIEGWDIKFSGSLNGQPVASARRQSPPRKSISWLRRSRL